VDSFDPKSRMNPRHDFPVPRPAASPVHGTPADRPFGVISVSELNHTVARLLERSVPALWVSGEISNLTASAGGHWYFKLKDARAAVDAVMFKGRTRLLQFDPREGDQVQVRAQPGLYEASGRFQLVVESMRPAGEGQLFRRFMQLKTRLQEEGLFDERAKQALPEHPRCVGLITSLQAAALRDVLTTLARRAPQVPVVIYPASVQGINAPGELIAALRQAQARAECDVLLLVRGGGSIEDLWAFNDEGLAREIAACALPVISGVGHETDFTIADFVADWRAPTPTAAAVRAVPDRSDQTSALVRDAQRLALAMDRAWSQAAQRLDGLSRALRPPSLQWAQRAAALERASIGLSRHVRSQLQHLGVRLERAQGRLRPPVIAGQVARLQSLERALVRAAGARLEAAVQALAAQESALALVSPQSVLERGYAWVETGDGRIVSDAQTLSRGDRVHVRLARGQFEADVQAVRPDPTRAGAD
jgi:exodeoxyribonuclease VII large subunit